jgi:hypothetical protein
MLPKHLNLLIELIDRARTWETENSVNLKIREDPRAAPFSEEEPL